MVKHLKKILFDGVADFSVHLTSLKLWNKMFHSFEVKNETRNARFRFAFSNFEEMNL